MPHAAPAFTRREIAKAAGIFLACFVAFYVLTDHVDAVKRGVVDPLAGLQARASAGLLRLAGYTVRTDDTLIVGRKANLNIKRGCDGILASAVFVAAVLAYPTAWRTRAVGALAGIVLLHVINLGRILSLFLIQASYPALFEQMHVAFWQALMILIAIFLWSIWERRWGFPNRAGAR